MGVGRLVRVEAIIERPRAPPWIGDSPFSEPVESWPDTILDWRWFDRGEGTWTALVQYRRDGLTYLHWVSGGLLDVEPEQTENEFSMVRRGLPE